MDHRDIRTLKLLEEIERNRSPSQRQLSRQLHISLGLVNSFIKRLAQKGYFKITHIPKNRVKYILTPKGAAEKTRLTYEYVKYSFEFYKIARQRLREFFAALDAQEAQRIVFWGATDLAEIAYISLQETSNVFVAVVDERKKGERFLDGIIFASTALTSLSFDRILITSLEPADEVMKKVVAHGISPDMLAMLDLRRA